MAIENRGTTVRKVGVVSTDLFDNGWIERGEYEYRHWFTGRGVQLVDCRKIGTLTLVSRVCRDQLTDEFLDRIEQSVNELLATHDCTVFDVEVLVCRRSLSRVDDGNARNKEEKKVAVNHVENKKARG